MTPKNKESKDLNRNEKIKNKKVVPNAADFDDIDLGDADDSSGSLGMDNFRPRVDKNQLPSERGRIEEL
jgi:hypothetical protein